MLAFQEQSVWRLWSLVDQLPTSRIMGCVGYFHSSTEHDFR